MRHLRVIASDEFEGRETGMRGQKLAAEYLRNAFMEMGIPPLEKVGVKGMERGYFMPFVLDVDRPGGIRVRAGGRTYRFMDDLYYFSERLTRESKTRTITVVAGVQMTDSMFKDMVLQDHALLWIDPGPQGPPSFERRKDDPDFFKRMTIVSGAASREGAAALFILTGEYAEVKGRYIHQITEPRMRLARAPGLETDRPSSPTSMQTIIAGPELGNALLEGAGVTWKKIQRRIRRGPYMSTANLLVEFLYSPLRSRVQSENVLAFIPGRERPGELVVVTAHYDHIGMKDGEIYNGADDDGSGTVALLEMAEAFAKANSDGHGPLRSVLLMPVSGEEEGLLGSAYYAEHPVFPLDSTVADLNIDMIGRSDSVHASSSPYVYVIGSNRLSSELHAINEEANRTYVGLELDYTFNAPDDPNRFYYRSDHYNFAKNGVPSIFYFSGVHSDYHGPHDEVERIRPDLLEQRARLVFYTAWALANRPRRIVQDIATDH
ncbi:MAG: M28 family peptidase [Flavobacteriales bacterium]|nr:M28 family peptidase [Flavobacteriales bacterium]